MALLESTFAGRCICCGGENDFHCSCRKNREFVAAPRNAALKLRIEIEAKEQHRRISIREAMHETRRARSLRELHDCYKFYRRTEGDYEKMMRIRRCLARSYRTMGDVEDVRLLAAFWATCGDLEQFVGLFLPYLEVTT